MNEQVGYCLAVYANTNTNQEDMSSLMPHGMHTHYTHSEWSHTHAGGMTVESVLCISPILASSPRDIQEQWAASDAAPGDQVQVPGPVLVRDRTEGHLFFLHVFVFMGFYGGNPGEHGENMQTPHRKATEMLHDAGLEPTTFLL